MQRNSTWAQFRLRSLLVFMALTAAFFAGRKSHERFPDIAALFRAEPPVIQLVVAKRDIPAGEKILANDVAIEFWPLDKVPSNKIASVNDAIGSRPIVALYAGEPLLTDKLRARIPTVGFRGME